MNTIKHTPPEWGAKDSIVYSLETGQDIARCDIGGRDEQTEANSKLIAAAPDLLKALQNIVKLNPYAKGVIEAQQAINKTN